MVQSYNEKLVKLEQKVKNLTENILAIENKYLYIARSETKQLYKQRSKANQDILKLRQQHQAICDHSQYEVETLNIDGTYIEDFCSNCNKSLAKGKAVHNQPTA